MRISDWSSDVSSSDLPFRLKLFGPLAGSADDVGVERAGEASLRRGDDQQMDLILARPCEQLRAFRPDLHLCAEARHHRSEEHTSELQSLMRISYAVFCLKKKRKKTTKKQCKIPTHNNI